MSRRFVTVFGGSGFVGRYIVKSLAERGDRIRVAVRRPDEALFLRPMGDVGQISLAQANLRDDASVAAALAGADAVVNAVGIFVQSGRQTFEAVHVEGARRVATAAQAAGVPRLVHISGIGVDPQSPSVYIRSKAVAEAAVTEAFPAATLLRPSAIFGPEDSLLNNLAGLARIFPVLPLFGADAQSAGSVRLQPVYVGDVADAVRSVLDDPATAGRTYELGGPHVLTLRDIVEYVLRETGRRRLLVPMPFALARILAALMELLPNPPLTRDQLALLEHDNVVSPDALGFADLGLVPTPMEAVAPAYLRRFRRGLRPVGMAA